MALGLGDATLGGIGLGITQGMQDRQSDVETRLKRLQLQQAQEQADTDKQVKAALAAAKNARGVQQPSATSATSAAAAPTAAANTGGNPSPQIGSNTLPSAGGATPEAAAPAGAAATPQPAAPTATATPTPTAQPAQQAPQRAVFDPDLSMQYAQIMVNSGDPRWMTAGQQMLNGTLAAKSAVRQDQQQEAMGQTLQAHNSLIQSFQGKDGAAHALDYLTGPGAAYMNNINYNGQNYAIRQDAQGKLVAVAHDPTGKVTAAMPIDRSNIQALATSVAQTATLNILGTASPEAFGKLLQHNLEQQKADASTTTANASMRNAATQEKDTQAKLDANLYGAQAQHYVDTGRAALSSAAAANTSAAAAMMNAKTMEKYRQAQADKLDAQADQLTNKLPEGQKMYLQQLKSQVDIATKAYAQDPQNKAAQVAMQGANLKLYTAYGQLGLDLGGMSPYQFAGITDPAQAAQQQLTLDPRQSELVKAAQMASARYGADYGKAMLDAGVQQLSQRSVGIPGVSRGLGVQQPARAQPVAAPAPTNPLGGKQMGIDLNNPGVTSSEFSGLQSALAQGNKPTPAPQASRGLKMYMGKEAAKRKE